MSESRNVQLLKEYLGALQASDGEKMAGILAPDLQCWVSPGSAFSGTHDKASLLTLLPLIFDAQAGPTKLTYREITAQDDRVSVVADGKMPLKSGGSYDQTYHWLFKFRDDLIVEVLEYVDILAVWKAPPASRTSPPHVRRDVGEPSRSPLYVVRCFPRCHAYTRCERLRFYPALL